MSENEIAAVGRKYDTGKLRYDLVPPIAIQAIAEALTYGAAKYEPNNWQNVSDFKARYTAAAMRHFEKYRAGVLIDEESNIPHLHLCACNIAFLIWKMHEEGVSQALHSPVVIPDTVKQLTSKGVHNSFCNSLEYKAAYEQFCKSMGYSCNE